MHAIASLFAVLLALTGTWKGDLVRDGLAQPVSVTFSSPSAATISLPRQRALDIPLQKVTSDGAKVHFELVGDATTMVFDGTVEGDSLSGTFREGAANGTFAFRRTAADVPPYRVEEAKFSNGAVTLAGSLFVPKGKGPHPAVIFLHGSGAEGRFASRFVADRLARAGVAALIYDKRGVGQSTGDWKTSSFEELVDDARAGVEWLRARPDIGKIGVYGHSQGGMLAPLLAARSPQIRFVISGAGSAIPLREAEVHSITSQLRAKGVAETDMPAATAYVRRYVDAMAAGAYSPDFAAETEKVRSASWFPFVHVPPADHWLWKYYARIANYDASQYWRNVTVPVLVMYGELDLYVPLRPSIANIDRALQAAKNSDYTLVMFPRASHSFNIEPTPGGPFEWPRVAPGFPEIVVAWVRERVGG